MSRINAAFLRALDLNADPVSGGQAFVYNAGTTDPVRTYSDVQLTSVQASPVVADAAGNFPDIYAASGSYKVVIQDAEGVTLYEADNVDIGGSSLVGSISPEDYTARGDGTGDDTDAMREFFAALPGRVGDLTPGATYVINSKLIIPGGDFTLNANGATLDFSGISNDDGDVAGALLAVSGTEQSTNQIITITTATTAFGLITTTVTMNDEHGLSVGDEVLISSDDIIDTGHNDANERRGQFMRVEELQGAFSFKSTQKLYETLPTNPVLTPISWAENIHIDGILRIKGPGRRPTEAGFIGLSFKYVRDVNIGDLVTEDVDYQVLSRDNCLRAHAGNLTFRFPPQGASTAVQYGDTFKNASTDCSTLSITSYGGKHPFDWTRNTTPGIGRHTHIGHILAYDTWDSVVATHGNSRDLNFTSVKGLNCLYVFGSRVADVRVDDIYGENCYEVLKITDDTRNLSVGSVRGKNVNFVVRAKDTPTTSNEGWIGSLESRNINIERVEGLGVTNNTLFLDWSDIPVFTEADAAVTGGSATTILLGAFPAPTGFSDNQYNFSGALTGSEIAMDWDGAGGGTVQTRTITGHTYAGGVNTLTVSGWTNNPVAGTSTYTIRSFVDDINIGRVISKNCVGSDVFVTGNLRRLVIGDMDVISETNLATAAVLIQGTANTYPDGVTFGVIRRFQKTAPVVSSFAQNVTFEASVTDPLILSADPTVDLGAATKQYVDDRAPNPRAQVLGAVPNTGTNSTAAFAALAVAAEGTTGIIEAGDYAADALDVLADTYLKGDGSLSTKITRRGTADGLRLDTGADRIKVSGIDLNMDKTTLGAETAGHGIVLNGDDVFIEDVIVRDYGTRLTLDTGGGTGALVTGTVAVKALRPRLHNSYFYPSDSSGTNVGWLWADVFYGIATNLHAEGVKKGIGYAHELKNDSRYNALSNLIAVDSSVALAYGHQTDGIDGADFNVATNVVAHKVTRGFAVGEGQYNITSNLVHDANDHPAGTAVTVAFSSQASRNVMADAISVGPIDFVADVNGDRNYARVFAHDDETGKIVLFRAGVENNYIEVGHAGGRRSIIPDIQDDSGSAGTAANVVHSPSTGERVGSMSRRFHDRFGESGIDQNTAALNLHQWRYESDQYVFHGMQVPGVTGDIVGMGAWMADATNPGRIWYQFGASRAADFWRIDAGGVQVVTASSTSVTMGAPVRLPSYAKAALPAAVSAQMIYVSDDVGGATIAFSDGTDWRRVSDRAIIA